MIQVRHLLGMTDNERAALCGLLADAVEGGASVGFLSPLSPAAADAYWRSVEDSLASGLALFVAEEDGALIGSVQLAPCDKDNGRHRAEVRKLFVLRGRRGGGVASRLMDAVEAHARALGLALLVLDTHRGSTAEAVYGHLGWKTAGTIPDYAASPDGGLHGTTFMYKMLGKQAADGKRGAGRAPPPVRIIRRLARQRRCAP